MFINNTQKQVIDALNQRKYLKLNNGLKVQAIDARTTGIYAHGRKFVEVVYKNDFIYDVCFNNEENYIMQEFLTFYIDSNIAVKWKKFFDKVIFSNILGCGVSIDDVPVIKVAHAM
tara:strand:+ start:144 stop:491 length:348 start_codon:yes stop_codon:yes gene_type:complete